jgi:CBS domain-containing protein
MMMQRGGYMKAKDIMIPLQDYLNPRNTLKEAVNLLRVARKGEERVGVKGLPVLNEKMGLVGMLSMGDILRAVYPSYMSMMNLGEFTWDGMLEEMAKTVADRKVEDHMTKEVVTVKEDDPLMECVDHMIRHRIQRLPVLDESGKVKGMIYERDLFFATVKAMLEYDQ